MAIQHGMSVLSWQENLTSEDMPESWMWPFASELDEWFTMIEERRKAKYGIEDEDDSADMIGNDLAKRQR